MAMQETLKAQPSLEIVAGTAERILTRDNAAIGVVTNRGETIYAKAIVITSGTFLKGLMHIGLTIFLVDEQGKPLPSICRTA